MRKKNKVLIGSTSGEIARTHEAVEPLYNVRDGDVGNNMSTSFRLLSAASTHLL